MTKKPYIPPKLSGLTINTLGKHSVFDVGTAAKLSSDLDVATLVKKFGSPLFIVSEKTLREDFKRFKEAFTFDGINTIIGYSYKTNYLPAVCAIFKQEGAIAEVVSGMEYQLAKSLGNKGSDIIFNGPYKPAHELMDVIKDDVLINIDCFDELTRIEQMAKSLGIKARIGLRINFQYGQMPWKKFGFSHEKKESKKALERVAKSKWLTLVGLHNHCGTFNVDPHIYTRSIDVLIECGKYARKLGLSPTTIDIGGGFPSTNRLKPEFDAPGGSFIDRNSLDYFSEAIGRRLQRINGTFGKKPNLVLEPGRVLVDEAVQLVTTVVSVKAASQNTSTVIVDAGVNILPTSIRYQFNPALAESKNTFIRGTKRNYKICGPLCMQIDVISESSNLPKLEPGAHLIISKVGAYNLTQSSQFIQPRPAVVLLGPKGLDVIRKRENWKDIFKLDHIPKRLNHGKNQF